MCYSKFNLYNNILMRLFLSRNQVDWEFHFHEVTFVGCCVFAYTWLLPSGLWGFLWWRGNHLRYTLLQLLAIYGYSIAIFIPLMVCNDLFLNLFI